MAFKFKTQLVDHVLVVFLHLTLTLGHETLVAVPWLLAFNSKMRHLAKFLHINKIVTYKMCYTLAYIEYFAILSGCWENDV